MEGKKISFGFRKTKKVEKPIVEEKKEFIDCMEEKSIKVVGGEQLKEEAPLVIPLKPNTLVTADRLKQIAEEVESVLNEPEPGEKKSPNPENVPETETIDQMVVRELLQEAKKEVKVEPTELAVPIPSKPIMSGQKESTLQDYEDVPVQQFGLAMLRGMGWTPSDKKTQYKPPSVLRPKGLGLGADKVVTDKQKRKVAVNEKGEELAIMKNSYVKITNGKYSGYYGKVVSLDEDNGRVMVDITVKKETVSLSEFMMQAVTKAEFDKESKVINADSFEEYKRTEKISQKVTKTESLKTERDASSSTRDNKNGKHERDARKYADIPEKREKDKHRRDSCSSEERSRKPRRENKKKRRQSSNDSLSSLSDSNKKKHKSSKKRYSSSESDSDSPKREKRKKSPEKKRDIDKKRKGKKKKRDRDRSPNYKKYRK